MECAGLRKYPNIMKLETTMKQLYYIKDIDGVIVKSGLTLAEAVEFLEQMCDEDGRFLVPLFIEKE